MSASNRRSRILLQAIMATGVIAALALAAQADLPITQIVATGDPAPDGGTFTTFCAPISVDRQTPIEVPDVYAFQATTSNNVTGIYYYSYNDAAHGGNLLQYGTVADTTQTAPTGGTYACFSNLSGGFGELGFIGTDSNGVPGVYIYGQSADLTLIATPQTLTPTGVPFGNFQSISIMSDDSYGVAGGEIESDAGIYDFDPYGPNGEGGQLEFHFVANTSTTSPGAFGPFTSFGPVSYKPRNPGGGLAPGFLYPFRAVYATAGGVDGIYFSENTSPYALLTDQDGNQAKIGAAIPSDAGTFTSFGNPIVTSNEISFTAHYSNAGVNQQGIFVCGPYQGTYPYQGNPVLLDEIVATGQTAPDSNGATFTGFSELTDGSFYQVFLASLSDGNKGLYFNALNYNYAPAENVDTSKIIETGDVLDGKTVKSIDLSPDSTQDLLYSAVFQVDFTDGTQGIYSFTLPEPSFLSFLALPILLIRRRRRS